MNPSISDPTRRTQAGLTLIELIVSVVLFAIIGAIGFLFLTTGVSGFIVSRNAGTAASVAQNTALRITMELRTAEGVSGSHILLTPDTSVSYTSSDSDLPGTRILRYDSDNKRLYLEVDGTSHLLLAGLASFTLDVTQDDLDGDTSNGNEISAFEISFTMAAAPNNAFNLEVMPREFIRL